MTLLWGTKPKKKKRKRVLNHQQKREVAKDIVNGMHIKQTAAKWDVGLWQIYRIINDYTMMTRTEKYPDMHFDLSG
jgi:transposase